MSKPQNNVMLHITIKNVCNAIKNEILNICTHLTDQYLLVLKGNYYWLNKVYPAIIPIIRITLGDGVLLLLIKYWMHIILLISSQNYKKFVPKKDWQNERKVCHN